MNEISITPPPGFRFRPTVESHGWYRLAPFRWDEQSAVMGRAETFDGERVVDLEISHHSTLRVRVSRRLTKAEEKELRRRLERMFQLDLDLAAFHELCATKESHQAIARAGFAGMPLVSASIRNQPEYPAKGSITRLAFADPAAPPAISYRAP